MSKFAIKETVSQSNPATLEGDLVDVTVSPGNWGFVHNTDGLGTILTVELDSDLAGTLYSYAMMTKVV